MTCAVFLDDAAGRGPLRVVPGSHRSRYPYINGGDIDPALVPNAELIEVAAKAGDVFLMESRLVHTSGTNCSGAPRRAFMATFCPAPEFQTDTDRRNRPYRERAHAIEEDYRTAVAAGAYRPRDRPVRVDSHRGANRVAGVRPAGSPSLRRIRNTPGRRTPGTSGSPKPTPTIRLGT